MVGQLRTEGALDDDFLEAADGCLELLGREWTLVYKLVENLRRDGRQRRSERSGFGFAGHRHSSCYASHTKFLTGPALMYALVRER